MRTLIAIPAMDTVPTHFAHSLGCLQKIGECELAFKVGSLIYHSRNDLGAEALRRNCDYVFWLDSDMVFPPDTLERMMAQMQDVDILTGVYCRRVHPYNPTLFDKLDIEPGKHCKWKDTKEIPNERFKVEGCGFGCVLMKTEVLLSVQSKFGTLFSPIGEVGEDLSFCWRAKECGYEIWADPSIKLGHCGHVIVTEEYWKAVKENA